MYIITLSQYGCVCLFHCFMSTCSQQLRSYLDSQLVILTTLFLDKHVWGRLLVLRAHFFCQLKLTSALELVEAKMGLEIFSCVELNMLTFEPSSGTHT